MKQGWIFIHKLQNNNSRGDSLLCSNGFKTLHYRSQVGLYAICHEVCIYRSRSWHNFHMQQGALCRPCNCSQHAASAHRSLSKSDKGRGGGLAGPCSLDPGTHLEAHAPLCCVHWLPACQSCIKMQPAHLEACDLVHGCMCFEHG